MKIASRIFRNTDNNTQNYTESYSRRLESFRKSMTDLSAKRHATWPTPYYWDHYGPGVDSASNINEYQEYFLGGG